MHRKNECTKEVKATYNLERREYITKNLVYFKDFLFLFICICIYHDVLIQRLLSLFICICTYHRKNVYFKVKSGVLGTN
jgi:hypothetical protein